MMYQLIVLPLLVLGLPGFLDSESEYIDNETTYYEDERAFYEREASYYEDVEVLPATSEDIITDNTWRFGEMLSEGDVFEYDICDDRFKDTYTGEYGRCYTISLDIQNRININNSTFYLIYGITEDESTGINDRLFLIDTENYNVKNIFFEDADYARSLQETVFWQNGWGRDISTEYGDTSVLLEFENEDSALILSEGIVSEAGGMNYSVTKDSFSTSHLTVNSLLPLPISADIYSFGDTAPTTRHLFSFEMNDINTSFSTFTVEPYPEIKNEYFEVVLP